MVIGLGLVVTSQLAECLYVGVRNRVRVRVRVRDRFRDGVRDIGIRRVGPEPGLVVRYSSVSPIVRCIVEIRCKM